MESIVDEAKVIAENLLPEKSKQRYIQSYESFVKWKEERGIEKSDFSENVMLVYFDQLQKKYKASSVWCFYSMLRTSILRNDNVDIQYPKLQTLLKKASVGYVAKKSNVFQPHEIRQFINAAPDTDFLAIKVIMIFGVYGAARADELTRVDVEHVKEEGKVIVVKVPVTKTYVARSFTIEGEYAGYVKKYKDLRPSHTSTSRFFIKYAKGKCANQPIGRNKFLSIPKIVAEYLKLPECEKYTGHSFRRTSATLLADAGADMMTLKRHGGWRSDNVVRGYVEDSVESKRKIGGLIGGQINLSRKQESMATSTITCFNNEESGVGSVTCSQSIVRIENRADVPAANFIHNDENSPPYQSPTNIISVPLTPKEDALKHMIFNNCSVNINFNA